MLPMPFLEKPMPLAASNDQLLCARCHADLQGSGAETEDYS